MPQAIIRPSAEADLAEIWGYIGQASPESADRLVDRIYQTCRETLAFNSRLGRTRDELSPGLRSFVVEEYIIFHCRRRNRSNPVPTADGIFLSFSNSNY